MLYGIIAMPLCPNKPLSIATRTICSKQNSYKTPRPFYPAAATEGGEVPVLDMIDGSINGPGVDDSSFLSAGVFAATAFGLTLARYGLTAAFASSSVRVC